MRTFQVRLRKEARLKASHYEKRNFVASDLWVGLKDYGGRLKSSTTEEKFRGYFQSCIVDLSNL